MIGIIRRVLGFDEWQYFWRGRCSYSIAKSDRDAKRYGRQGINALADELGYDLRLTEGMSVVDYSDQVERNLRLLLWEVKRLRRDAQAHREG